MLASFRPLRWLSVVLVLAGAPLERLAACQDNNGDQSDQPSDPPPDPSDDGTWGDNGDGTFTWLPDQTEAGDSSPDPTPAPPPAPPAIAWSSLPGDGLSPGNVFAVSAQGSDSAGLLAGVLIDWSEDGGASWSPFAYAGGNDGYTAGDGNPVSAAAGANYQFRTWATDSVGQSSAVLYSGVFAVAAPPAVYPVIISASGPGGVSTPGGTYAGGTTLSVTALPTDTSRFDRWSGDYSGTDNPITLTVTGPMTVTASFTDRNATLSVTTSGSGTASGSGTYPIGSLVPIAATPADHARFANWSPSTGVQDPSSAATSVALATDLTVTANFTAAMATLTTAAAGNGQVSGGGSYPQGGSATVTALPSSGAIFVGWSGDLSGNENPASLIMGSDKTVTGRFTTLLSQTITAVAPPNQPTTAPPIMLQATASSGLPVSFQLLSGPGRLAGAVVTLTGQTGSLTVQATQAGNEAYSAAPAVTLSFAVTTEGRQTTLSSTESATKKNDPKTPAPSYLLGPNHP